ncbi:MAG: DNA polymerase III subunit beta, partial [Spirochaetota bacterium]
AKIENPGKLTLHAKKMMDILRTFPSGDILIEADSNYNITVTSQQTDIDANFRLQGISPDEYPEIENIEDEESFTIPQHQLRDMLRKTIYAVSKEESRYFLQGIFFEKKEGQELRLIATDGHRLSISKNDIESLENYKEFGVMVPQKPLNELLKVLENEGDCIIAIKEKRGFFKLNKIEISTNFIETDFLNYNSVIPKDLSYKIIAQTQTLSDAIKRISSILDVKEKRIKFEIRENYLNIYADNPNLGEAKEKIEIEYDGKDIDIGLNYDYMLQTLKEIKNEKVIIEVGSDIKPIIVKEEKNQSSLAVIGPMRLEK